MHEINLPKTAANFLRFLKNSWILSLVAVVLVSSLFTKAFFLKEEKTNIEITILSSKVPFEYIEYILKPIKSNVANRDFDLNVQELELDKGIISDVTEMSIKGVNIKGDKNFNNGLTITLSGTSKESLELFGKACLSYLNSNPFINDFRQTYTENLDNLFLSTSEQIRRIDSIQTILPQLIKSQGSSKNSYGVLDFSDLYQSMLDLQERREEIKRERKFNKEFKLISITHYSSEKQSNLILVIGLLTSNLFVLAMLYYLSLFIIEVKKY